MGEHAQQPWQLAAMQKASDFGGDKAAATERYQQIAAMLSGMLHPGAAERLTATQLAQQHWLQNAGNMDLEPCPIVLQR